MRRWLRGWLRSDDGMTLVELMVALVLLGVILSALASVLITSLTALQREERRVRATHLANQAIEGLRGLEWDEVGFYAGDAGYVATWDGEPTVTLTGSRPGGSVAPLPTATRSVDGVDYDLVRHVTWADDPSDGVAPTDADPNDHMRFHVVVSWDARGSTQTVSSTGIRVPTLEEVPETAASPTPAPATLEISDVDIQPNPVPIAGNATTQPLVVTVTTTHPAHTVRLDVPVNLATLTYNLASANVDDTVWRVELPAGTTDFDPPGSYDFSITAAGTAGIDTEGPIPVLFAQPPSGPVEIQPLSLSRPLCRSSGNPKQTYHPVDVSFEVFGVVASDPVSLSWTDPNGGPITASYQSTTANGAIFRATIPAGTPLTRSTTTLTATATRTTDSATSSRGDTTEVFAVNSIGSCPA